MRLVIVAGMMAMAGGAAAQEVPWQISQAAGTVAEVTGASAACGFRLNEKAIEETLSAAGFKRGDAKHDGSLRQQFSFQQVIWHGARVQSGVDAPGKAALESKCRQIELGYGPAGTIRKGLVEKQ